MIYQDIARRDRGAARDWRELRDLMAQNEDDFIAPDGVRGALVGTLDEILGDLGGVMDVDPRRLFTASLIGGEGSSKKLTEAQARILLNVLTVKDDETDEYEINHDNADKARGITIALAKEGITPPILEEDITMNQLPTNQAPQAPKAAPQTQTPASGAIEHAEAPLSATARFVDQAGASWLFTVREGATGEAMANFVGNLSKVSNYLIKQGFKPEGDGYSSRASAPAQSSPSPAPTSTSNNGNGQEGFGDRGTFEAEEMVASVHGGKTYWKIKGGPFAKYGITIWPEVMEEQLSLNADSLDVSKSYDLRGWTAEWEQSGEYKKIVALR